MIGWVICLGCLQIPPSRQPHSPVRLPAVSPLWGPSSIFSYRTGSLPRGASCSPMKGLLLSGIQFIGGVPYIPLLLRSLVEILLGKKKKSKILLSILF